MARHFIAMIPLLLLLLSAGGTARAAIVDNDYFVGNASTTAGESYLTLLDAARRMIASADPSGELMTLANCYDPVADGLTEGAQWAGNFWTQNSYGFAFASQPFIEEPLATFLQHSMDWWFDHMADGGQTFGGIPGVPDGILCDNGSPGGCNYKQCGPSRNSKLTSRKGAKASKAARPSSKLGDTPGIGKDFIIEGTLAGVVMQAERLLVTRNATAIAHFLPLFLRVSNFMESRRVQDDIPNGLRTRGMFFAGAGANLLAPSYGGWNLPPGCITTSTFNNCTQRTFAYLVPLTITYSAALDRMVALEKLAYPHGGHACTSLRPNSDAPGPTECRALYAARRALNEATLPTLLGARMNATRGGTRYFVRSIDPDGTVHGDLSRARHAFFESAPNHDAVALRVVNDSLAAEVYASMDALGTDLRPCAFTLPNWPDYDDSCGDCDGGPSDLSSARCIAQPWPG